MLRCCRNRLWAAGQSADRARGRLGQWVKVVRGVRVVWASPIGPPWYLFSEL